MNSNYDKIQISITNIEAAIKYYLKEAKNKRDLNKMPQSEYLRTIQNFNSINDIIHSLKFDKPITNPTLDSMRSINLSLMALYEEENDYHTIANEIYRVHSNLCKNSQEKDKKRISRLKQAYNNLSNFYKYRLSKAEIKEGKELDFRDKGIDNIKFITEKYLNVKYNVKKVKYESINISEENSLKIAEYTKIIEGNEYDINVKNNYTIIRDYLINYAKAEVIITGLSQIKLLCDQKEFSSIKEVVDKVYNKYQHIYNENKAKYDVLIEFLDINSNNKPIKR